MTDATPTFDAKGTEFLQRIDHMMCGPEEREIIAETIRYAEETGDERLAYEARMRLTQSAHMTGDTDAMLSSFGWCVGKHDSDPAKFPLDSGAGSLLFQYKWMAGRLTTNPLFSLEQVAGIHDDMARRYREAGATQSGVLQSKFSTAMVTGRLDEARAYMDERNLTDEDDYSHCEACVRNEDAYFFQVTGDAAKAIRLYDEIFEQGLSCGEEPETSEAEALLPYLRAGRFDDARAAHLRSYRVAKNNQDGFGIIADHLVFCAITGNEARGLNMLERHLRGIAKDPVNRSGHFTGLLAIGVLLDAVVAAGFSDQIVRGSESNALTPVLGSPALGDDGAQRPRTAAELSAVAWAAAEALAEQFNARNGNDYFSQRITKAHALAGERYAVPVESVAFRTPEPEVAEPTTAEEWCERAIVLLMAGDAVGAKAAIDAGLRLPIDSKRASLLGIAIRVYQQLGQPEAAEESHVQRLAELRASGRTATADLEQRLGMMLYEDHNPIRFGILRDELERSRSGEEDDDVVVELLLTTAEAALGNVDATNGELVEWAKELVSEAVTRTTVSDPHEIQPSARLLLAHTLLGLGRMDEAIVELDALVTPDNRPRVRIPALTIRAQIFGATNDYDAGTALAEELVALQASLGNRAGTISSSVLSAALLSDANRDDEAARRIRYAITQAELSESAGITELTVMLGRYLHYAGESDAALEKLDEAYRTMLDEGAEPAVLADILYVMGEAARVIGENGMAYGAWNSAIEHATQADEHLLAMRSGLALGTLLIQFNDEDAIDVFETALTAARALDNPQPVIMALQRFGAAKAHFEDATGIATIDEALALAADMQSPWLLADLTDSRARALHSLKRIDEAMSAALQAADGYAASQDEVSASLSELFVGRLLVEQSRHDEAVPFYESALERMPSESPQWTTMALELAEVFEALNRHDEAAAQRAAADAPPADLD
ncbi:tetratricopeptide repeat protein [Lysinibacter cavernae]|uniref:Tetratricopeptide (TPR) repeat protein n=1 Tax=Lysinibacter cavernae TaxID=1640652 RepID=A0A7X5R368_9MICO|nr:tetratricopeptide repeat protein [Lysinibacter cavernae]NIH54825.1 tetratricopeptide (TPR) repeat protein [Lysinibacter cavernae]